MTSDNLTGNAADVHEDIGRWALCVGSYPDLSPDEIAVEWPYRGPSMRTSTVGRVRDEGFDVVPDREEGRVHALLILPGPPSEPMWDRLRACFTDRQVNPAYGLIGGGV